MSVVFLTMPVRVTVPVVLLIGLAIAGLWVGSPSHREKPSLLAAAPAEHTVHYLFQGKLVRLNSVKADVVRYRNRFTVILYEDPEGSTQLSFTIQGMPTRGVYMLDNPFVAYAKLRHQNDVCTFFTDHYYQGVLIIDEHQPQTGRLKGSFEFLAFSEPCREIVRVQGGRFHVTYRERDVRELP